MARKKSQNQQAVQNSIKTLLANIRFASVDNPVRTLVVTSTVPNEGKSTITAQLARPCRGREKRSGRRKRYAQASLAGMFNVHPEVGLHAVLADEVPLNQAIVALPQQGLYFLDAEPHIPNPPDLLSSKRFAASLAW